MGKKEVIHALVEGGNAKPTPPLGPKLSQYRLPVGKVVADINKATADFKGMQVPVKIIVDIETKEYTIEVGTPPTSALIKKYAKWNVQKKNKKGRIIAAQQPWKENPVANLSLEDAVKIAKAKIKDMNTLDLKAAVKMVLGTALSMGITVNGKNPKEIQREIDEGKYNNILKT